MNYDILAKQDDYNYAGQIGTLAQEPKFIPPTRRKQLEIMRDKAEAHLKIINDALDALDKHPELENFLDIMQRAL